MVNTNRPAGSSEKDGPSCNANDDHSSELTLDAILDKYYKCSEETGNMRSTSLYYFMEFLEKYDWKRNMDLLRFWASTEKYRRLVWRIGAGIVASTAKAEEFSPASHLRLQKEVLRIYETFLSSEHISEPLLTLSPLILESYHRYTAPLQDKDSKFYADDYLCVIKTQKRIWVELEKTYNDFQHSDSFFQLSSELEKFKVLQTENLFQAEYFVDSFESSALMTSLEAALCESCIKLTGVQNQKTNLGKKIHRSHTEIAVNMITLDELVLDSSEIDVIEQTSPLKDEDEEDEVHAPGELLINSSKLSQVKQNIDSIMQQLHCVDILHQKVQVYNNEVFELN